MRKIFLCILLSQAFLLYNLYGQTNPKSNNTNDYKASTFSIQAGISSYNFYDPQLYGEDHTIQTGDVTTGNLKGFRDLSGIYIKAQYYFVENLGVSLDVGLHSVTHELYYEQYIGNTTTLHNFKASGDLDFERLGITGRFIADKYPVKVCVTTGFGRGGFSSSYHIEQDADGVQSGVYYEGETSFPMVFFQAELNIPVYIGIFIFSQYEYTIGWTDEYRLVHEDGYNDILYRSPGFGGNCFRAGLGYEL